MTFSAYAACSSRHPRLAGSYVAVLGGAGHAASELDDGAALEETPAAEVAGGELEDLTGELLGADDDGGASEDEAGAELAAEEALDGGSASEAAEDGRVLDVALDGAAADVAASDVAPADEDGTPLVDRRELESV